MNRYLYTQVHSHIFHSSQKVETAQVSIDKWVDRQNVIYTCGRILFSLKMEWNLMSPTTWMDLENTQWKIQKQKDKYDFI